ncbi:hypothetical protein LVJ94_50730 [Pendulispora rubella]|uniref:Uncharacterized protein n=1 Tax=Pendulispora rubella TaxID=2741070 RepID=A0ABZ2L7J1_9BACT
MQSTIAYVGFTFPLFFAAWMAACSDSTSKGERPPNADSADVTSSDGGIPVWPDEWNADIKWSDVDSNGATTNTWTGHVSYDWKLRAMRTDVVPPAGGRPGPPIGTAGTMLMREGRIYFIPTNGHCSLSAEFGAPRPDWLVSTKAVAQAHGSTSDQQRLAVESERLDGGLQGCFNYVFGRADHMPRIFGGGGSCQDWPKGFFIEYSNFSTHPVSKEFFDVPADCTMDSGAPGGAAGCTACHDAPN